ncbi:class I SAM-dependent methyltransferase [Anatilimnocola sp. NA78]|uniref:class I SAM-dependent methyltransferase n=1 Tax=Anatilimnocola sp. NA78 TaxID=3415683 RepID=UPI003CE544D2
MKTRESGMPAEPVWETFFNPELALDHLGFVHSSGDVVDLGCGYGTFTIPAARRSDGIVHAFDIDAGMVASTLRKAQQSGLTNVRGIVRDFVSSGTGLPDFAASYAMLFNLLHAECPGVLLAEAWRVLAPGGVLGIMHWNHDRSTPRGPSMNIRPTPQQCCEWAIQAGFEPLDEGIVQIPPYHYGMAMRKPF